MNQAKNEVFIEGILLESDIQTGTSKENKEFIRGELRILVNQKIGDKVIESIIPVRMFSNKLTKEGKSNKAYESILKVKNEFVSAAAVGGNLEEADAIRITSGSLDESLFVPRGSDKEASFPEIQSNFINKISRDKMVPMTKFNVNVVVNSIREEIKHEEATGALILKGAIVQYNDKLDLVEFKIYNEAAKNHIQTNYNKGDTVNIQGYVNFTSKTEYVEEEQGFGEPILTPKTTTVRELVITTGSVEPFSEERAYAREDLNKALSERAARIVKLKEDSQAAATTTAVPQKGNANDTGF